MLSVPLFQRARVTKRTVLLWALLVAVTILLGQFTPALAQTHHVWDRVEITLHSEERYENPYKQVEVWVDLEGPGFEKRCYGFWDGEDIFRVRVLAGAPGTWSWKSGSNQPDSGLNGKSGGFTAVAWSETQKQGNPCRRGMVKPSANGHAFEYADGTPFFLLGDTWWPVPTFRYRWYDDDNQRPIGPAAGLKDYLRFRKKQGFNCIAMIAALGNWANDDKPARLTMADGTVLRAAWKQAGTQSTRTCTTRTEIVRLCFPARCPAMRTTFLMSSASIPLIFGIWTRRLTT